MSTCGACDGDYRTGTIAVVVSRDERPARRRVCPKCVGRGTLIVPRVVGARVVEKVVRNEAVETALRMLTTYASAAKQSGLDERAEAFEAAIETLKRAAS